MTSVPRAHRLAWMGWIGAVLFWMEPAQWLDPQPLVLADHPLLIYQMERGRAFFALFGRPWGYDPFFSAGYPLTFVWNSNVLLQLLAIALPFLPAATVSKLFILGLGIAVPAAAHSAARRLTRSDGAALAAASFSALLWLTEAGWFYLYVGMLTGPAVFFAILLLFGRLASEIESPSRWSGLLTAFWAGLAVLTHKTGLLLGAVAGLAWLIAPPVGTRRALLRMAVWSALGIAAVNLFWMLPAAAGLEHKVLWPDTIPRKNYSPAVLFHDWLTWKTVGVEADRAPPPALMFLRWALVAGAAMGLVHWRRTRPRLFGFFAVWLALAFVGVYGGHRIPNAEQVNPYRYQAFLKHLVALPAGAGWAALGAAWIGRVGPDSGWARWGRAALGGALAAVVIGLTLTLRSALPLLNRDGLPAEERLASLLAWLESRTDGEARLLIEQPDNPRRNPPPSINDLEVGACASNRRLCANAVYSYLLTDYQPLRLINGRLNGVPIDREAAERPEAFAQTLAAYNVGWILCWSPACRGLPERFPDRFVRAEERGPYRLLTLAERPGWWLRGGGRLRFEPGRIGVEEARPEAGRLALRFHYVEGMRAVPSGELGPLEVEGDPNPFLEVRRAPSRFWIQY